ncbi:MAG: hypothetical protein ACP5K2_02255 [bacterium]
MRTGDIQPLVIRTQELEKIKEVQRQTSETIQKQFQLYFRQVTEQRQNEVESSKESNKAKDISQNEERKNFKKEYRKGQKKPSGESEDTYKPGLGENIDIKV